MWPERSACASTGQLANGECADPTDRHGAVMESTPQPGDWSRVRGHGLRAELAVVREIWSQQPRSRSTKERLGGLIERFASRLVATGVASLLDARRVDCESFIWARTRRNTVPALATVHLRRSALSGLFAVLCELEPGFVDPTVDVALPAKTTRRVRPLTDAEMTSAHVAALGRVRSSRRAVLSVALAEATATTGEIPQVRWRDLDLAAGTVQLLGASPVRARRGQLSSWGVRVLRRVLDEEHPDGGDFVVERRHDYGDAHSAQAAVANLLTKVLITAGLTAPGIRPTSIRLWGARQVLVRSGIEAAAAALGITSLDAARNALAPDEEVS